MRGIVGLLFRSINGVDLHWFTVDRRPNGPYIGHEEERSYREPVHRLRVSVSRNPLRTGRDTRLDEEVVGPGDNPSTGSGGGTGESGGSHGRVTPRVLGGKRETRGNR